MVAAVAQADGRNPADRCGCSRVLKPARRARRWHVTSMIQGMRDESGKELGKGGAGSCAKLGAVGAAHCFCISPGPNGPRSPPFLNEPQSLRISAYLANASSVLPSAAILSMYVWSSAMAASPLTFAVDSLVRRETGLREPLNLMRRWRAAYFGISAL